MGLVTGLSGAIDPGGPAEAGLRMAGKFSSGRLLLDFTPGTVTLDCGQAHVRQPYTVENAPNALLVHVQNSGGPFTLALQPDNSLLGAGSTAVNGRLVTGMNGDNVTYAAHSERCEIGTLHPKPGAGPTASVAVASAAPAPVAGASTVPVSSAPSVTSSAGGMSLSINTSIPNGRQFLGGHLVMVMSDSFDNAMRKSGAPIAAGTSPGNAYVAWVRNCSPPKDCSAINKAMAAYIKGKGKLDDEGKVTLSVPFSPGSYFVLVSTHSATRGYAVWDLPVTLKPGENTITLSTTNGEVVP
jgi:hypothetical protein